MTERDGNRRFQRAGGWCEPGSKCFQVLWLLSRGFEGGMPVGASVRRCVSAQGLLDPMSGGRSWNLRNLSGTAEAVDGFRLKETSLGRKLFFCFLPKSPPPY